MTTLKHTSVDNHKDEKGAALLWVAGSLTVLLTMAAFAVDLGWIYLNSSRLQAAADAAALAGVVHLPGFRDEADADAALAAGANYFPIGARTSMSTHARGDNQFEVTLSTEVDTFFLTLIGMDTVTVSRKAAAEYIKPVALGSPSYQFGGPDQNFWAAINGRYTEIKQGDPYASLCINHSDTPETCEGPTNPLYRPGGYYYAVEVFPGSSGLTVSFYDGGHYMRSSGCNDSCSGSSEPSDTSWRWSMWPSDKRGVEMEYRLWKPDQTPLDPTDNSDLACQGKFPTIVANSPSSSERSQGHYNTWDGAHNCSIGGSLTPGIWVLQLPSPLYEGSTKFAIRATVSSGPMPRVYGLLDMSIHVNFDGGSATPYLAEVRPEHRGRTLEVDIFDLGEVWGNGSISFINAAGGTPRCSWTSTNGESAPLSNCVIDISDQRFNEEWLHVKVEIPETYSCDVTTSTGCWWKIRIEVPGSVPTDRTTWSARITGDPVRLTE